MRDRSTMGPVEFMAESIFWGAIAMIWYKSLLFRCIGNLTYGESRMILWGMLLLSVVGCCFILFRKRRTGATVPVSIILGYGIYTVIAYWNTLQRKIEGTLLLALAVSIAGGIVVMTRKIKTRKNKKRVIMGRMTRCIELSASTLAIALAAIMFPYIFKGIVGTSIFNSDVEAKKGTVAEKQTISANIDTVLKLQQEEWKALSTKEKLNVLQCIANIEASYLGISNELNVGASNLEQNTLASYDDGTHTIYIDLDLLEKSSAEDVLDSLCHEAYHGYQHRLVDVYNSSSEEDRQLRVFNKVADYADEFGGAYVDGDEDFYTYYSQQCETDARAYAKNAVEDYYSRIDAYLEESAG